jgi:glycosyltransferase involved in cell wall biosynthesis
MPSVSVILTNHNKWPFIEESVNSVINQSNRNWELIVVNDSCDDFSVEYLSRLNDERIKIFNVNFKNASAARNFGFDKSSGDFIQYLDADDILDVRKIELQLNSLKEQILGLSVCRTIAISESGNIIGEIDAEFLKESDPKNFIYALYKEPNKGMVQPNAWFFSRELHELTGKWNEKITLDDDGEFFCRMILNAERIIFCDAILNYYRKYNENNKSLSSAKNFASMESAYFSGILKIEHLECSGKFSIYQIDVMKSSFFSVIASNSYLVNHGVYKSAMIIINKVGKFHPPFPSGISFFLSFFIGWRCVKILKFLKDRIFQYFTK